MSERFGNGLKEISEISASIITGYTFGVSLATAAVAGPAAPLIAGTVSSITGAAFAASVANNVIEGNKRKEEYMIRAQNIDKIVMDRNISLYKSQQEEEYQNIIKQQRMEYYAELHR